MTLEGRIAGGCGENPLRLRQSSTGYSMSVQFSVGKEVSVSIRQEGFFPLKGGFGFPKERTRSGGSQNPLNFGSRL